jgi:hypothetical protein
VSHQYPLVLAEIPISEQQNLSRLPRGIARARAIDAGRRPPQHQEEFQLRMRTRSKGGRR